MLFRREVQEVASSGAFPRVQTAQTDEMRAMETNWCTFRARRDGDVDGDTVDPLADLGFRTREQVRVRLREIDAAEVYGVDGDSEECRRGTQHSNFVGAQFEENADDEEWSFILVTEKDRGTYGRWPGRTDSKQTGNAYNEDVGDAFPAVAS